MKTHIFNTLSWLDEGGVVSSNIRWEFLKYEIRKSTKNFSKAISDDPRKEKEQLKQELKLFERDLQIYDNAKEYINMLKQT